eukprot:2859250-Amphidinium_carterae.1
MARTKGTGADSIGHDPFSKLCRCTKSACLVVSATCSTCHERRISGNILCARDACLKQDSAFQQVLKQCEDCIPLLLFKSTLGSILVR